MPRFLSPEWVDAFNAAIEGADLAPTGPDVSVAASDGRFRVTQVVHNVPDAGPGGEAGTVRTVLLVADCRARLVLGRPDDPDPPADPDGPGPGAPDPGGAPVGHGRRRPAEVTIALSYADAVDLSRGALVPAEALGAGLVKVRGDLSVLVAGQHVLAGASAHLADLHAGTTY